MSGIGSGIHTCATTGRLPLVVAEEGVVALVPCRCTGVHGVIVEAVGVVDVDAVVVVHVGTDSCWKHERRRRRRRCCCCYCGCSDCEIMQEV